VITKAIFARQNAAASEPVGDEAPNHTRQGKTRLRLDGGRTDGQTDEEETD